MKLSFSGDPSQLTDFFDQSFGNHTYRVTSVQLDQVQGDAGSLGDGIFSKVFYRLNDETMHPLWILLVQMFSSYLAFFATKFASKVWIQSFSFAFPVTMTLPSCVALMVTMCGARAKDKCAFEHDAFYIPNRLFYECPDTGQPF